MGDSRPGTPTTRRFDPSLTRIASPWSGRTEQVFGTAALVRGERDGRLVTLLESRRSLVPWGVTLPPGWSLPGRGARVSLGGRELSLPGARLRFLGPGVDLGLTPGPGSHAALRAQLAALPLPSRTREILDGRAPGAVADLLARRASTALAGIVRGLQRGELERLAPAVHALVGLGPGSTPTGDDLLVGLAAAARRFDGLGWLAPAGVPALDASLRSLPADSTTAVGQEMITHSAGGTFPEALARFAEALGSTAVKPAAVRRAAATLASTGGSSGEDMLAGALALARAVAGDDGGPER